MSRQEYEQSRTIDAPPEEVFAGLSDVGNLPKYLPPVVGSSVEGTSTEAVAGQRIQTTLEYPGRGRGTFEGSQPIAARRGREALRARGTRRRAGLASGPLLFWKRCHTVWQEPKKGTRDTARTTNGRSFTMRTLKVRGLLRGDSRGPRLRELAQDPQSPH